MKWDKSTGVGVQPSRLQGKPLWEADKRETPTLAAIISTATSIEEVCVCGTGTGKELAKSTKKHLKKKYLFEKRATDFFWKEVRPHSFKHRLSLDTKMERKTRNSSGLLGAPRVSFHKYSQIDLSFIDNLSCFISKISTNPWQKTTIQIATSKCSLLKLKEFRKAASMSAGASKAPIRPQVPDTDNADTRIFEGKVSDCARRKYSIQTTTMGICANNMENRQQTLLLYYVVCVCVDVFMRRCLYTLYVVLVETRYVTWILKKIWLDVNSKCHAESDLIVHVLKFRWLSLFWCWVFRTGNKIKIQQQMFMQKNKKHTNTNGGLVHNSPFIRSQSQSKKKTKEK